jgi:hypothetical protein
MKFVCTCSGGVGLDECAYAIVEMPSAYITWLLGQLSLAERIKADEAEFFSVEFYDHQVTYYGDLDLDDAPDEHDPFVHLPEHFTTDKEPLRTTASTVRVTEESIVWMTYPKHGSSNEQIETAEMPVSFLRDLHSEVAAHLH